MFIRKLRRHDTVLVRSLEESPVQSVERQIFDSAYKGVTDLVTKHVWPVPAYWATSVCARLGIVPNAVTLVGIAAAIAVAFLWATGQIVPGLILAWLMTFLDTIDGKLARVTVTSSRVGDILDHATDIVHPPFWWVSLAAGLHALYPSEGVELWLSCAAMLIAYLLGRGLESLFKGTMGYNAYLWKPFDSAFRLIVSRRNIILLIMTLGLIVGAPVVAFVTAAAWTVVCVLIQFVRYLQASSEAALGGSEPWLK
jgi:phosphatidylglycerophosphate synthase